jgi:hypothetical protein
VHDVQRRACVFGEVDASSERFVAALGKVDRKVSGYADDLREQLTREIGEAETLEKPLDAGSVLSWVQLAVKRSSGS